MKYIIEAEGIQLLVDAYAERGGRAVHRAWRDGMLAQGRYVAKHRLEWETLHEEDHLLDQAIAQEFLGDFFQWLGELGIIRVEE